MFADHPISPDEALAAVTSKSGKGVYASADRLFKGAVFGRDSLEVAEDLMLIKPDLVRHILLTMVSLQGTKYEESNEEEVGKIVHEYRTDTVDGQPLDDVSKLIFKELSERWGGNDSRLSYYGSVDATPHFVRVLCQYCRLYSDDILQQEVTRPDGTSVTVRDGLQTALKWILGKLEHNPEGLLAYRALNPLGIKNQVWKDSQEFYVHSNGERVNPGHSVASIEVQGLVYDALRAAAQYCPDQADELIARAKTLRGHCLELFWLPEDKYFALGMEFDDAGGKHLIDTRTANPANLLESTIFDDLPDKERTQYIGGIVRMIFSPDFLTNAGIRSRALSHAALVPFWDYHGSYTTWPKETADIAKGLRHQKLFELAYELENRLLNAIRKSEAYPEFIYVDAEGRVLLGEQTDDNPDIIVESTNRPEHLQAWTISAVMRIIHAHLYPPVATEQAKWREQLQSEVMAEIPHIKLIREIAELEKEYPFQSYRIVKYPTTITENFLHDRYG